MGTEVGWQGLCFLPPTPRCTMTRRLDRGQCSRPETQAWHLDQMCCSLRCGGSGALPGWGSVARWDRYEEPENCDGTRVAKRSVACRLMEEAEGEESGGKEPG